MQTGTAEADLAIDVPYEDLGTLEDAGSIAVIYGAVNGLTATSNQFWTQDTAGAAEPGDGFGRALTAAR